MDDRSDTMTPDSDAPVVYTPPTPPLRRRDVIVIDDDAPDGTPAPAPSRARGPQLGPAAPSGKTVGMVVGGVLAVAALNVYLLDRARTPAEPDAPAEEAAAAQVPAKLPVWLTDASESAIVPPAESVEHGDMHGEGADLEAPDLNGGSGSEDGDVKGDAPKAKRNATSSGGGGNGKAPATVLEAVTSGCSTASVDGLSRQIIAEGRCIDPDAFAPIPSRKNLNVGSQVFLYLEAPARDALLRVLDENPSKTMVVNSALRTIAQQFILSKWGANKRCGVELAATPGESNHESGLALDIREPGTWRPLLEAEGFKWFGPTDKVHFDYRGAGSVDHTGKDVLAFQRLWNRNHADDPINLTGHFDAETEARMKKSPPGGFPIGAKCGKPEARPVAASPKKATPPENKPASDKKKSSTSDTKKKKSGSK